MRTFILLLLKFIIIITSLSAQKEDYHWIIGRDVAPSRIDTLAGNSSMDFKHEPVKIYHETFHEINMAGGNASLCDKEGNLVMYTNGQVLINGENEYIEDTINYDVDINYNCNEWEYNNLGDEQNAYPIGLLGNPRILLLPINETVYAIYNTLSYCDYTIYRVLYSKIKIDLSNPLGKIVQKDNIAYSNDSLISSLHAVRHGNGRDWWVVTFTDGFESMISFLVNETGVHFHQKVKTGYLKRGIETSGQIIFSPNGKMLSLYTVNKPLTGNGGGFCIWDFDRCSGEIRNLRTVINNQPVIGSGVAFSNDSRYLYVCNDTHLWQYDVNVSDIVSSGKLVSVIDSFFYVIPSNNPNPIKYYVNFWALKPAPDGRIYIFPSSATQRYLSYIDYPHENYDQVGVRQHAIYMPRLFTRTVPNIPEFRLGPDDGSPCDTLGLDNHPVAKFRYEPDSSDYKKIRFTDLSYFRPETWRWDFGDGSPIVTERYPFHTYSQNGTYEVCLTVSNENSNHTSCRTVTIGTSSSEDAGQKADITLFPNPVSDVLLVTLGEYIPQHGMIHIVDATGQKVISQRIYYGHNQIDMTSLPLGLYFWMVEDDGVRIKGGKVVKI
ncbi:MAG: PKD domain-containing protein [Saprospiraceae bacterium]